jgi:hypothetical protein
LTTKETVEEIRHREELAAVFINGLDGAFWGASYYVYAIGIYYAITIIIVMREYSRFYAKKKHQMVNVKIDYSQYTRREAANPTLLVFFLGLLFILFLFIVWGFVTAFIGTTIPKAGEENFITWVGYNIGNMLVFLGWTFLVFFCYTEDLKNNKLTVK